MSHVIEAPHRLARSEALFRAGHCEPLEPGLFSAEESASEARHATGNFLMVDDVNASLMPRGFYAAAYYANGPFENLASVESRGIHVIAPTMLRDFLGDLQTLKYWEHGVSWDIEPSLFVPSQAGMLVHRTRSQGVFPHLYCPLSFAAAVCGSVKAAGFAYNDFGLHTAHWTGTAHICSSIPTVFGLVTAASTQFTDRYLNLSLDCSMCQPDYLGPFGRPGPPAVRWPLRAGMDNNLVRRVQRGLFARGFHLAQDGKFGAQTEGTVKAWQHEVRRHVSGVVTRADWDFMFPTLSLATKNHLPGATKALQRMLDWHGYHLENRDEGKIGDFGSFTEGAVRQFQSGHHLTVDGVVGPNTWGRL